MCVYDVLVCLGTHLLKCVYALHFINEVVPSKSYYGILQVLDHAKAVDHNMIILKF